MNEVVHKVGSIKVHIQSSTSSGLYPFMDHVSTEVQDATKNSLESWWDQYAPAQDALLQIDKVSVELGSVRRTQLIDHMRIAVDTALRKRLDEISVSGEQQKNQPEEKKSGPLFYFLHHGCLPWNCRPDEFDVGREIRLALKETSIPTWKRHLQSVHVRKRMSQLIEEKQLHLLIERLAPGLFNLWKKVDAAYVEVLSARTNHHLNFNSTVAEQLLVWALEEHWTQEYLVAKWLELFQLQLSTMKLKEVLLAAGSLEEIMHSPKANKGRKSEKLKALIISQLHQWLDPKKSKKQVHLEDAKYLLARENIEVPPTEYFVENAGIIILWPGFKYLFEETGLVNDGQFIDKHSRMTGVRLIHYLHTKSDEESEYWWPLNKVLCGLDPAQPIDVGKQSLTKQMKAVANEVRQEILKEWNAPFSESEMIANFLYREGKLTRQENGWLLQIERKAWDVLLDRLPWSIGIIRLPWIDQMIYTEW